MDLQNSKPSTLLKFLIWITIIPILLGQFFKVMHWPGASPFLIFGSFIFSCIYLPLFTIENWKTKNIKKEKAVFIAQIIVVFLFAIGFIFKIQHWPFAGFLFFINNILILSIVIPYSIYCLVKSTKHSLNKSHNILLVIYFFCLSTGTLMNTGSGKVSVDVVVQQGLNAESSLEAATSRNAQLYTTLNNLSLEKNAEILKKTQILKDFVDRTVSHIRDLKSHLLTEIDKTPKQQADTLSSINIVHNVDYDVTTFILIGNEYELSKDKYSAYHLKTVIKNFKDSMLSFIQERNRPIIKEGLNLNTDDYTNEFGEPVSWERTHFYYRPLIYVFSTLTNIQYEIKNAEFQALTDIVNSDDKELNTALFNQIATWNSKFDAAKKQEEITRLRSEKEKGIELINEKNIELDDSRQTIMSFVLIVLIFIILGFFVIRSNYLRKQTNKTLVKQNEIIEAQKTEVESQKHLVEEKQKEIIDSISYAKRLQEAILPPATFIKQYVPNNFILYKPKDLVAGDFYWAEHIDDLFFIAAADSTGHGVPGAMVSVVCSNALNRTVKEFGETSTGKILDKTRELVLETFSKSTDDVKDGMDISLLCIDKKQQKVYWSGANNALWYIHDNVITTIKPNKQPIGKTENPEPFTSHEIDYVSGTVFYLFTDGYADQFGGEKGKKFKYKQFEELLSAINDKPLHEQSQILEQKFENWKGSLEQVDDVCVIGIKI